MDLAKKASEDVAFWVGAEWRDSSTDASRERPLEVRGLGEMCVTYLSGFYGRSNSYSVDSWVTPRCEALWGAKDDLNGFLDQRIRHSGSWGRVVFRSGLTRCWYDRHSDAVAQWW